jgi:predicted DNA-binding transcriptional regulator AlpA
MQIFVTPGERLIKERDVAKITGLSSGYLRILRTNKKGPPYIKLGWSVRYKPSDVHAWQAKRELRKAARPKAVTKKDLRQEISDLRWEIAGLRRVGSQMANVCYNLGQPGSAIRQLGDDVAQSCDVMWDLRQQWDAIPRVGEKKAAA